MNTRSTQHRLTRRRIALGTATLALLVSACGGGSSSSTSTTAKAGAATTVPEASTAAPSTASTASNESGQAAATTAPGSSTSAAPSGKTAGTSDRPVAMIVAQGGLGDQSYNDLANEGLQKAGKETGLKVSPVEAEDIVVEGQQVVTRAADSGYGLIIDLEFSHNEFLPALAAKYPDTNFAFFNLELEGNNIESVVFQEQEGSYMAGALAAMMTTVTGNDKINPDKTIGVVGGFQSPGIDKFIVGFKQGAMSIDPDIKVLVSYTNDFGDPTKGKDAANAMYEQGADIVYQVAGGAGLGVIEAAKDTNHYAIGVDTDQDGLAPGFVLTSMIKRTDLAVEQVVKDYSEGKFAGGTTLTLGLAQNGVELSPFEYTKQDIPAEALKKLDEIKADIISGKIEVWNVIDQGYPDFYKP